MGCTQSISSGTAKRTLPSPAKDLVNELIADKWELNEESLSFLRKLKEISSESFHEFMIRLKGLFKSNLLLKSNHIDTLIAALKQQIELPIDALESVDDFLKTCKIDYKAAIEALRKTHGPELDSTAQKTQRLHHAAPHALEIRLRTMFVFAHLDLFSTNKANREFLKTIISFMIEFHDHEQIDPAAFGSVEEATADRVLTWLYNTLDLTNDSALKTLLAFIANRVIVLGTTMVFSSTQAVDLSELYLVLEDIVKRSGLIALEASNKMLVSLIDAVMLIAGVCDKSPAAIHALVKHQQIDSELCTLDLLKTYAKDALFLTFFTSEGFKSYYSVSSYTAVDFQAFFITLAPHLSMRTELAAKSKPASVNSLIQFIADCRGMRFERPKEKFLQWYDDEFTKRSMVTVVEELFFTQLQDEILFSRSQTGGLKFVTERLIASGILSGDSNALINCDVPERDANNIIALEGFYGRLDRQKQIAFAGDLVMAVVIQAGAIYSYQYEHGYYSVAQADKDRPSAASCRLFNSNSVRVAHDTGQTKQAATECGSGMF